MYYQLDCHSFGGSYVAIESKLYKPKITPVEKIWSVQLHNKAFEVNKSIYLNHSDLIQTMKDLNISFASTTVVYNRNKPTRNN